MASSHPSGPPSTRLGPLARLAIVVALLAVLMAGLPRLQKEPSVESMVRADSPELALRAKVRETFGLKDPIVVALAMPLAGGLLTEEGLDALRRATEAVMAVPEVDPEQVFSLSTQQWARSEGDALIVEPVLTDGPVTADSVALVRRALDAVPIYRGTLVATDDSAALIVAELRSDTATAAAYERVLAAVNALPLPAGMETHVAGEAVSAGFLSTYMERDSTLLTGVAVLLMVVLLRLFLRSWQGVAAGLLVMLGTLGATVGAMAWVGAKFYVVTICMPPILMCISIADIIHYGERVARLQAQGLARLATIDEALRELWRPILLTSLTNASGFAAMALTSNQPALIGYGAAASFGVMVAWLLTVIGVPAIFERWGTPRPPPPSAARAARRARVIEAIASRPRLSLAIMSAVLLAGLTQSVKIEYNEDRIRYFGESSTVFRADQLLSDRFAGSNYLDVYLEAAPGESLLTPDRIARIDALQRWMRAEGGFAATYSFVDLLQATIRAARPGESTLPQTLDEAEQFLLLYEVSGKPGDLRQEIATDRSRAYIRGHLRSGDFRRNRAILAALKDQLDSRFAGTGVTATPSGAVVLSDSFVGPYLPSTMWGIAVTVALVGIMCAILMRSVTEGLVCLVPVGVGIVFVFGVMGALRIWISVATAQFASIGIGLGVDFAIHTLHAKRRGLARGLRGIALSRFMLEDVGSPLTANAVILALGFSVTILSSIPTMRHFGLLIGASICASYVAAVLILPAIYALATRERRPDLDDQAAAESNA